MRNHLLCGCLAKTHPLNAQDMHVAAHRTPAFADDEDELCAICTTLSVLDYLVVTGLLRLLR
jgi:hypothetical protein